MDTARRLYDTWDPLIRQWAPKENVEIEFRLGRKTAQKFDTNIGRQTFDRLMHALKKYDGWESVSEGTYSVYYGRENRRITVDEKTDEAVSIRKTKCAQMDFGLEHHPFDVRLGISLEVPYEHDGAEMEAVKLKKRWSFVRKNLSIDLTELKGDPEDKDNDEDVTWHAELEIVDPKNIGDRDSLFALMYKIFNVLECVN